MSGLALFCSGAVTENFRNRCKAMEDTEKLVENGLLYDFYGSLLTKHQQKIYEEAVYEDLSLGEIADLEGISRQAVHDLLKRTTAILEKYEKNLGLVERFGRIRKETEALRQGADAEADSFRLAEMMKTIADRIDEEIK